MQTAPECSSRTHDGAYRVALLPWVEAGGGDMACNTAAAGTCVFVEAEERPGRDGLVCRAHL